MTLGEYLSAHSIRQHEFAAKIQVSASAISHWILGVRAPRPAQMRRIREATGGLVTPNDFLPPPPSQQAAE